MNIIVSKDMWPVTCIYKYQGISCLPKWLNVPHAASINIGEFSKYCAIMRDTTWHNLMCSGDMIFTGVELSQGPKESQGAWEYILKLQ